MKGAVDEAERLATEHPETYYFCRSELNNPANPQIHEETTGPDTGAAKTSGTGQMLLVCRCRYRRFGFLTYRVVFKKVKGQALHTVAVEPAESPIIAHGQAWWKAITPAPHKIKGNSTNFLIPKNLDLDLVDEVIAIESAEAIDWAR